LARGTQTTAHTTLEEIESIADRIANWIGANPAAVIAVAGFILLAAGSYGGWVAWRSSREDNASFALASLERDYLKAMGAAPGATEITEPANPETGKAVRREFAEKLLAMASEHSHTSASSVARLTAGDLLAAAGEPEKALDAWQAALGGIGRNPALRGVALRRVATALEAQGKWSEAAAANLEAGELTGFPLRQWALADAARCYAEAGDRDRAASIADRVESQGSSDELPPALAAKLAELRVQGSAGAAGGPAAAAKAP
jgi:predicted negative regulator of RcsB-dependent stress response